MISPSELRIFMRNNTTDKVIDLIDNNRELLNIEFSYDNATCNILTFAVEENNLDLVKHLVKLRVKPITKESSASNQINRLLLTCKEDAPENIEILQILLDQGVGFSLGSDEKSCRRFVVFTMAKIYEYSMVNIFKMMIKSGFDPAAIERDSRVSMIAQSFRSSSKSSCEIAEILLSLGCSINPLENDQFSPLAKAVDSGHYEFAKKLISSGALLLEGDFIAIKLVRHAKIPKELRDILISKQDLNKADWTGYTPITSAIEYCNEEYIRFLVKHGADLNNRTEYGTPLIFAIENKLTDMAEFLISIGADINAIGSKGKTPLDVAKSLTGLKKFCSFMVKSGAKTSIELKEDRQATI